MSQRNIKAMSADDLWESWKADIEEIEQNSYELFAVRRQFQEIHSLYTKITSFKSQAQVFGRGFRFCTSRFFWFGSGGRSMGNQTRSIFEPCWKKSRNVLT